MAAAAVAGFLAVAENAVIAFGIRVAGREAAVVDFVAQIAIGTGCGGRGETTRRAVRDADAAVA